MIPELPESPCIYCSLICESKMIESSPALLREECSACIGREQYALYTIHEGKYNNTQLY